ncbi:MAG: sel1 repeat family protein [Acidobacteria bacterium]|nr:sel1 repeat family protein [Acidobacteriota bacterium]MBI3487876.1 sel1 repeat family protein [Acidobacteriota bacterium]
MNTWLKSFLALPLLPQVALVTLMALAGCNRPRADVWPRQVQAALSGRAAGLSADERAEYEAGFGDGAAMVHQSLKAGVRPFRPVLNLPDMAPLGMGPLPEGVERLAAPPVAEVDAETGLLMYPASAAKSGAFAQSQADGFTWALAAIGQSLRRPVPQLVVPANWQPFLRPQEGQDLDAGKKTVRLLWAPGHLAWAWKERGFPSQRTWRVWTETEAPSWISLSEQALWVENRRGHALAVDLESGGILAVRPAMPHAMPQTRDWTAYQKETLAEYNAPETQRELAALREAAASGETADLLAVAKKLASLGEPAERESFIWYLKAAEGGSPEAMLKTGVLLFHGRSISADKAAARMWLDRAIQAGQPMAGEVRDMLFQESK